MQVFFAKADVQKESLLIGLLALLLFTIGLWGQPFVAFDSRFALFAQEMWRHGPSWFPTTYGDPYPDYPATSTVFIWFFSLLFGGVTKLSAVLPTALAAALNLAITYRLLARFSRTWALATVCFELLTVNFLAEARAISLDQMVATVTLLSFYLAYTATQQQRSLLISLSLLLVTGFAIRGPLGTVIPAGVVCSYYLLSAQWKNLLRFGLIAAVALLVCWFGLLALSTHFYGADFTREVIHMQVVGRMDQAEAHQHSYYFTSSFGNYALSYPIAALVVLLLALSRSRTLRKPLGNDAESFLVYLIGWALVVMVGLSIPATKKIRYLLPIVPAIAALAAYPFSEMFDPQKQRLLVVLKKILEQLLLIVPALALVGLWAALHSMQQKHPVQLPFAWVAIILFACQVMMLWIRWRAAPDTKTAQLLLGSVLTMWLVNLLVVEPVSTQLHDTGKFVQQVEVLRQQHPGQIVFFRMGKDASAIKYLVNLDYDLQPQFLGDSAEIDALGTEPAYIILQDKELTPAQQSVRLQTLVPVLHDHFDREYYTVFYLAPG